VEAREFTNREGTRSRSHLSRQNRHSAASGQAGRAAGASRLGAGGRCWALLGAGGRCWALLGARVRQGTSAGDTGAGAGALVRNRLGDGVWCARRRADGANAGGRRCWASGRLGCWLRQICCWAGRLLLTMGLLVRSGWAARLGCSAGLLGWPGRLGEARLGFLVRSARREREREREKSGKTREWDFLDFLSFS